MFANVEVLFYYWLEEAGVFTWSQLNGLLRALQSAIVGRWNDEMAGDINGMLNWGIRFDVQIKIRCSCDFTLRNDILCRPIETATLDLATS